MRIQSTVVFAFSHLAFASQIRRNADAGAVLASHASLPASNSPVANVRADMNVVELRQAPDIVLDNVPGDMPASAASNAASTTAVIPNSPTVVLASTTSSLKLPTPSMTSSSSLSTSLSTITSSINTNIGQPLDYTTTKWVETWIGGTYSTWTPTVITVIHKTPAPAPPLWHGEIGMGSLTGEIGKTETIYMGAAPSEAAGWAKGVAAVIGVGIAGMVV